MIGLIVNRTAGNGRGATVWQAIADALRERNIPHEVAFTEYGGHATQLAEAYAKTSHIDSVVAVGGDGTVNEAAAGLIGSGMPLGYIPAGSGNDFARGLKLPNQPMEALNVVLARNLRTIDAGYALNRYFVNSFGAGFDGEVARAANSSQYKGWMNRVGLGRLSYAITVASTLWKYEPLDVRVKVDDTEPITFRNVWMTVVANSAYYGGGMMISPEARNDDGLFSLCIVHGLSRFQLIRYFPRIYNGSHVTLPYVSMLSGRKVTITAHGAARPMACHLDGEPAETGEAHVTLIPSGLTVIA
jgi:diacylglycerol kinase (ATP)